MSSPLDQLDQRLIDKLIAQHNQLRVKLGKAHAAVVAVTKQRDTLSQEVTQIFEAIHALIGPLKEGSLVSSLSGHRLYEVQSSKRLGGELARYYPVIGINKRTGKVLGQMLNYATMPKTFCASTYSRARGSLIPVPPTHPTYSKWAAERLRRRLDDTDTTIPKGE